MKLSSELTNPDPRMLGQFTAGWVILLVGAGVWQYAAARHPALGLGLVTAGLAGGVLGRLWPTVFRRVFVGWMLLAWPLGWLVSQLALALMFYVVLTPVAFFFRWRGRDRLARRKTGAASYWLPREQPADVRRYFRQY